MRWTTTVGLVWIVGSTACVEPDSRCSLTSCEEMLSCGVGLFGVPEHPSLCAPNPARPIATYCVQSCNEHSQGEFVACFADNFGHSCPGPDGGLASFDDIQATCEPNSPACGTNCQTCGESCETTETACDQTCPDAGSCLDCEYQCSIADGICENACPTD